MIGNSETAYNKVASIVMGFKEVIDGDHCFHICNLIVA